MTSIYLRNLGEVDPCSPLGTEWETLVSKSDTSGFMQSLHWMKFKRHLGFKVMHLGLFEGEKLLGGAIFYSAEANKGAGILAAPDGPVLPWHDLERAEEGMRLLMQAVQDQARLFGITSIRIAPRLIPPTPGVLQAFSKAPINLTEPKTLYLPLQPSVDDLLAAMKPKGRYNIRLSERNGVDIYEQSSLSAAGNFYSVMQQVASRDRFCSEPLPFFIELIGTLCQTGMARIFFARHEKDILGALLLITFGGRATYLYGGTTNLKRALMGGYALQWAAIKAAKESGCEVYDFYGFDQSDDPDNNYAGFSRFKSQFGGTAINMIGSHDFYFIDNLADAVIRAMNEIQLPCG